MASPILVTGGTGTLGRLVVPRLRDAERTVRVLSRRQRAAAEGVEFVTGDLATGEGIEAAVQGAGIVVHCAGSSKGDEDKARNLVRAASRAGAQHLVYISVVGANRVPLASGIDRALFGYFGPRWPPAWITCWNPCAPCSPGSSHKPERHWHAQPLRISESGRRRRSDNEEVEVTADRCQRSGADPAQLASSSLIGHGTDLLRHGIRNLLQPGAVVGRNLYVMVEAAIPGW